MSTYPRFPQISPLVWEHPRDRAALMTLRKIPKLDELIKMSLGTWTEGNHLLSKGDRLTLVTKHNNPALWNIYQDVLETFDVTTAWPLYVLNQNGVNAYAYGINEPFITITVDASRMQPESVRMILAHEAGHLLAGHGLYRTMLSVLLSVGWLSGLIPVKIPIYLGVLLATLEWQRCSEFTADRASALAMGSDVPVARVLGLFQDPATPINQLVDMLKTKIPDFMLPVIQDSLNGIRRLTQTHPDPNLRVSELKSWCESASFESIIAGDYPHRNQSQLTMNSGNEELHQGIERISMNARQGLSDFWKDWNPF